MHSPQGYGLDPGLAPTVPTTLQAAVRSVLQTVHTTPKPAVQA